MASSPITNNPSADVARALAAIGADQARYWEFGDRREAAPMAPHGGALPGNDQELSLIRQVFDRLGKPFATVPERFREASAQSVALPVRSARVVPEAAKPRPAGGFGIDPRPLDPALPVGSAHPAPEPEPHRQVVPPPPQAAAAPVQPNPVSELIEPSNRLTAPPPAGAQIVARTAEPALASGQADQSPPAEAAQPVAGPASVAAPRPVARPTVSTPLSAVFALIAGRAEEAARPPTGLADLLGRL